MEPETLPAEIEPEKAPLPDTYERAKNTLAQCEEVDECKDWGDKAKALASYAKQAGDSELEKMAKPIRARALRRAGELLKEFQNPGKRTDLEPDHGGVVRSQREAADNAGMSRRQEETARSVSEVPEEEFEDQVESENPPNITELSEQGKQTVGTTSRSDEEIETIDNTYSDEARTVFYRIKHHIEKWEDWDHQSIVDALYQYQLEEAFDNAKKMRDWLICAMLKNSRNIWIGEKTSEHHRIFGPSALLPQTDFVIGGLSNGRRGRRLLDTARDLSQRGYYTAAEDTIGSFDRVISKRGVLLCIQPLSR